MAYGRKSCIAQKSRNRIAAVWVMQMGGGYKGMVDSIRHLPLRQLPLRPARLI